MLWRLWLLVVPDQQTKQGADKVTWSPIELFWTAKKFGKEIHLIAGGAPLRKEQPECASFVGRVCQYRSAAASATCLVLHAVTAMNQVTFPVFTQSSTSVTPVTIIVSMQYRNRRYYTIPRDTVQYGAMPCNIIQYCSIPYNYMQYHSIFKNIWYYTIHAIPCNMTNGHLRLQDTIFCFLKIPLCCLFV